MQLIRRPSALLSNRKSIVVFPIVSNQEGLQPDFAVRPNIVFIGTAKNDIVISQWFASVSGYQAGTRNQSRRLWSNTGVKGSSVPNSEAVEKYR